MKGLPTAFQIKKNNNKKIVIIIIIVGYSVFQDIQDRFINEVDGLCVCVCEFVVV